MKSAAKIFLILLLFILLIGSVSAQGILPSGQTKSYQSCDEIKQNPAAYQATRAALKNEKAFMEQLNAAGSIEISKREFLQFMLGCAIKWGEIHLFMLPFFITFIIQFLLSIAGLISVGFIVYGGYQYSVGGLIEDKESGKKTVLHALVGLLVALSSWIVVNFIQVALTS